VAVSAPISGLTEETKYRFRLVARNAFGSGYSDEAKFTTTKSGLPPVIRKVAPGKGHSGGGTAVKIKGENLEEATAVFFGEVEASFSQDSVHSVTAISPPGTTGTVNITIRTPTGTSAVTSADRFTYGKPAVLALSPSEGPKKGGTEVTVTGSGFPVGSELMKFYFGQTTGTSVECTSTTTCTVLSPAIGKPKTVQVKAAVGSKLSGMSPGDAFKYTE